VQPSDLQLLVDVTRDDFERALARVEDDIAQARQHGERVEVVVYYSGHSDADGLLLGRERLPYGALREEAARLAADVRLVILDSCSSGALTRMKGGTRRPAFLVDEAGDVRGHAYLTSSSQDEAAQESDALHGSFFTHALVSGLRGAADSTDDGKVTLNEIYQFAFNETLARTERTQGGAQHPAYDIQLSGTGDLVLTDLRETSARLTLNRDVDGRVFVRDDKGNLVVELKKVLGAPVQLAVAPGSYDITVTSSQGTMAAHTLVAAGKPAEVAAHDFADVDVMRTVSRGGPNGVGDVVKPTVPFAINFAFVSPLEINNYAGGRAENALGLHLLFGSAARLNGLDLSLGGNWVEESARGAMFALGFNGARDVDGAMITAGLNLALHDVHGTQLAALANLALHDSDGLQLAGLVNFTSGDATFAQVSPLANIALGSMSGAQVGLVNFGGHIRGAQIGVVNVADHVDGTQVGVLNISNDASAPIGVLNIVREGQAHLGLYGSDVTPLGVQARLGSSFVYTTVQLGVNPLSGRDTRVHAALGPGVHLPFLAWGQGAFVDVEATTGPYRTAQESWFAGGVNWLSSLRVLGGIQPLPFLSIYAGPSFNVFVTDAVSAAHFTTPLEVARFKGATTTILWPGLTLGVQL
jgi:hypothetical protein